MLGFAELDENLTVKNKVIPDELKRLLNKSDF